MKKILTSKYLWVPIIGFLFGLIWISFVHLGYFRFIADSMRLFGWYVHVLMGIAAIFLVILIHEIGHLIVLRANGIKIRAIYIFIFVFVKNEKWQFKIFWRFAKYFGGLVMPIIEGIQNENDYQKLIKGMRNGIKAGPIVSASYCLILLILGLIAMLVGLPVLMGITFILIIITLMMTLLVMAASNLEANGLYGDFVAAQKLKNDELFTFTYIISGILDDNNSNNQEFLHQKGAQLLIDHPQADTKITRDILSFYIDNVIFDNLPRVQAIENNLQTIKFVYGKDEERMIFNYRLAFYYLSIDNLEQTQNIMSLLKRLEFDTTKEVKLYYEKFTNHYFGLENNQAFLSDQKNYWPNSQAWLYLPVKIDCFVPIQLPPQTWYNSIDQISSTNG